MGVFIIIFAGLVGTTSALVAMIGFGLGVSGGVATYFVAAGLFTCWGISRPVPVMRNLTIEEQITAWQYELESHVHSERIESDDDMENDTRAA